MILKSLKIKNVKCFNQGEIEFVLGKNVIIGNTGSGKSTILQSILYSLIGQYPEGTNDQLVRSGKDVARFKLNFEHNGKEYEVERRLRRYSSPEAFLTDKTGNDLIADTQTDVTQEIQSISQIKKEIFQNVILVRQGEIAKIIDMRSSDRIRLFDNLLGIHDYKVANERCVRIQRIMEGLVSQKEELIRSQKEIADKLPKRKKDLDGLKNKLKQNKEERRTLQKKLNLMERRKRKFDRLEEKLKKLSISADQRMELLEKQNNQAEEDNEAISELCGQVNVSIPKELTIGNLLAIESKATSNQEIVEQEIASSREQQKNLIQQKSSLDGLLNQSVDLQSEIRNISSEIEKDTSFLIKQMPEIIKLSKDQWLQHVVEKIKYAKGQRVEIRKFLGKSTGLQEKIQSTTLFLQDLREQRTNRISRVSENNTHAEELGSKKWRKSVQENVEEHQKKLDEIINSESELRNRQQELVGEIGKAGKKVEDLRLNLTEVSDLLGRRCPKCKQIVDEKHAEELSVEIQCEIPITQEALVRYKKDLEESEQHISQLMEEGTKLRNRIELVTRLKDFYNNDEQLKSELKKINDKIKKKAEALKHLKSKLSLKSIKELRIKEKKVDTRIDLLSESKQRIKILSKDIPKLEELRKKLEILNRDILALQHISPSKSLEVLEHRISSLDEKQSILSILLEKIKSLTKFVDTKDTIEKQLAEGRQKIGYIEEQYNQSEHKTLIDELQSAKDIVIALGENIRILSNDQIPFAKETFEESWNASENINAYKIEHQKATDALAVLSKLREFYSEIQRPLRHRDITRAANHASEIFQQLVSSSEFGRVLITEDHSLLISRFGKLEPLDTLSGGEQVLACLAIRLGFARALATSDLIILDEPTTFLDDQRRTELIDTLSRVSPAKQMLIVTHNDEFEKVADRLIHVEKDASSHLSEVSW